MGIGRDLGLQLRDWIQNGLDLSGSPALTNRLMDALGADPGLRGPLRDLAAQPLTLRALNRRGAEQQAALQALTQLLAETYNPRVLAELLDLLEAATGVSTGSTRPAPAAAATPPHPPAAPPQPRRRHGWQVQLRPIAPGLLAGAIGALVLAWAANELDRWTFSRLGWSTGAGLAAVLLLLELLSLVPRLRPLRRRWLLDLSASGDPHRIWRWISAAWLHARPAEGLLNSLMLLILLGTTPLGAGKLVLRYLLTTLACHGAALLVARRFGVQRRWGGATGAIAALISLAAGLSLLQGQSLSFSAGALVIPAWVLLTVYGGLQLSWQLPSHDDDDTSTPLQRLGSSSWWWGSLAGLAWALITRAGELLGPLLRSTGG